MWRGVPSIQTNRSGELNSKIGPSHPAGTCELQLAPKTTPKVHVAWSRETPSFQKVADMDRVGKLMWAFAGLEFEHLSLVGQLEAFRFGRVPRKCFVLVLAPFMPLIFPAIWCRIFGLPMEKDELSIGPTRSLKHFFQRGASSTRQKSCQSSIPICASAEVALHFNQQADVNSMPGPQG